MAASAVSNVERIPASTAFRRKQRCTRRQASSAPSTSCSAEVPSVTILGTGRVGASTARALLAAYPQINITFAGRNEGKFAAIEKELVRTGQQSVKFKKCDIDQTATIAPAIEGADVVVHAAGPFQRRRSNPVLEAAIAKRAAYLDVSDDSEFSKLSRKTYGAAAKEAGVSCITSAGIFPGVSNLMAARIVEKGKQDGLATQRVTFSYFTAGSGGVGPTILATNFLLCGEDAVVAKDGQLITVPAVSNRSVVDFGQRVGKRETYIYNLPEVESAFEVLGVPNIVARFGTDPGVFNTAMELMARALPKEQLQSPDFARSMAAVAGPFVKAADLLVGERVAMRIDADLRPADDGEGAKPTKQLSSLFVHKRLSVSVGNSVAAFARAAIEGGGKAGVLYPEEPGAVADPELLLTRASEGCSKFENGVAGWTLDGRAMQLGFGLYLN